MATTVNITRSLVVYLYGLLVGVTVFQPIDARLLAHLNRTHVTSTGGWGGQKVMGCFFFVPVR